MNKKTVVITGIGGFIGRHLATFLRTTYPHIVIAGIGRAESPDADSVRVVDLLDSNAVQQAVRQVAPDYIFHLAGSLYSSEWHGLYASNVQTTINVLEAVRVEYPESKVIVPGSAAEYGAVIPADLPLLETQSLNPVTPYGVAKSWQTTVARYYAGRGVAVVIGRIFNVIGKGLPETLSIGAFVSQLARIKAGQMLPDIRVGNLKPKRDFVDVRDVCAALTALAEFGNVGETYNVCSGKPVSIEHVLNELIARSGLHVRVSVDPDRIKNADIDEIYGSNRKIHQIAGWHPSFSLSDSIATIIE